MRKEIKRLEREVEKRYHKGNGVFIAKTVDEVRTFEVEDDKIYECVYEYGELITETNITDWYNLDGTEKY